MKQIKLLTCFAIAFIITGCDLFDDSPCGPKETLDIYLLGPSIVDSTTNVYYSYTEGNNRIFQWSELVENVCAVEHVKFDARVALLDETTTGISARSRLSWLFFFEEQVEFNKTSSD